MKLLLENWKEFLVEESDELSEMATAWKKRGLAGPYKLKSGEMGSTLEVLKQYVTPDTEKPTHFIHFGGVGHRDTRPDSKIGELDRGPQFKFGVNPRSNYHTPTGIYAFPLSEEIYKQLEYGELPFAQDEPFILLFKPKETLPIIYTSEDIPDDEYREYIEKLFSQDMIDAELKGRMKTLKVASGRGWDEEDVKDSLQFIEKGKKEIEELSTKGTWATKSRNSASRWEKLAKIPQQFFGRIVNRAIEIYGKKAYGTTKLPPAFDIPAYYQKAGITEKEINIQHLRNIFDNSRRPTEWAEVMSGAPQRTIEAAMYDRAGAIIIQDLVGPLYRDGAPNWEEAARNYVKELKLVKNEKYNRTHYSNINFQEEGESDEDYYLRLIDQFQDFLTSAVTGDIAFSFIEATEEIMEKEKKEDEFGFYTPPLGDEWHPRDLEFVRKAEASAESYLTDSMRGKFIETNSGYLWNLTRLASNENPVRWNVILRRLGIGGIVDDRGTGHIHSAEPEQAVFFSKADPEKNVELIKVFPNTHTKKKIKRRRMTGPLQDLRNLIKRIAADIHPNPNFKVDQNFIDGVTTYITNLNLDKLFFSDAADEGEKLEALKELKDAGYRILHDYFVRSYALGSFKELEILADEFYEQIPKGDTEQRHRAAREVSHALGAARDQLKFWRNDFTTTDQEADKMLAGNTMRASIAEKFAKIDEYMRDFKDISNDALEDVLTDPGEDENKPSTWASEGPGKRPFGLPENPPAAGGHHSGEDENKPSTWKEGKEAKELKYSAARWGWTKK